MKVNNSDHIFYVYVHVRGDTGHVFYVGKGKNKRAWSKYNRNKYWKNISDMSGYRVFIVASGLSDPDACALEIRLISAFHSISMAEANMTNGGDGTSGYVYTQEHRDNLSKAKRGTLLGEENPMRNPEIAARMGKTKIGNKNCVKWDKINFFHPDHGLVICSGYELRKKYNLNQTYVSKLVNKKTPVCCGWIIIND